MQSSFTFELDGESYRVDGEPVNRTLAEFLHQRGFGREDRFRFADPWLGGAPLILLDADGKGKPVLRSVDATLFLLPAVAGRRLWSAEGLVRHAATHGTAHPALAALQSHPELECSWLGRSRILTAFFEGYYREDLKFAGQVGGQLDGCQSRTTAYPALRAAAESLFSEAQRQRQEADGALFDPDDPFARVLAEEASDLEDFSYVDPDKCRFYRPQTIVELAKLLAQFPSATLTAGSAERLQNTPPPVRDCLISTDGVGDLRALYENDDSWIIGAATPLTSIEEILGETYPALQKIFRRFANRTIRNRVTLGGYLAAARPDSELVPALIALDAEVRVFSIDGERDIPIGRFIEGPGKTNLRQSEFVADIIIPRFTEETLKKRGCQTRLCDTYKAGIRRQMGGTSLAGGFAVELDDQARITKAWIAYSGIAELPFRARGTEKALTGKPWSEDTVFGVLSGLSKEVQSAPGAAAYQAGLPESERQHRNQLIVTLFQKFFYQHLKPDGQPIELGAVRDVLQPNRPLFSPEPSGFS